jgi:Adenylate cyclase, class 2 (thermophilic)
MAIELEVKILNIDKEEIQKRLKQLGCNYISDRMQKIIVYDFPSINSEYNKILYEIANNDYNEDLVVKRLKNILNSFFAIIDENDVRKLGEHTIIGNINEMDNISDFNDAILQNELFNNIINKYTINPNKWLRLRTDGSLTTLTVKNINRDISKNINFYNISDVEEFELIVDDFEECRNILMQMGYYHRNYQEKRRTTYRRDNVEIVIDEWPLIPPYIEIEADSRSDIYSFINELGYDESDTYIMNTDDVYRLYNLNIYDYKNLKF